MTLAEFKRIVRKKETADAAYAKAVKKFQKVCKHPHLIECEYKSMNYGSSMPPLRVCKDCGLSEDGWSCGYEKLRQKDEYQESLRERIPLVSRETVYRYMRHAHGEDE